MISTLAMFGNNSWWHTVATGNETTVSVPTNDSIAQSLTSICQSGAIPFTGFQATTDSFGTVAEECLTVQQGRYDDDPEAQAVQLRTMVYGFFSSLQSNWISDNETATILDATTFFANEAVLTAAADLKYVGGAKWIYASDGTLYYQPYKSLGGMIAVTVLIFLQVIALLILAWYIHAKTPVWTDTLDGFAMMRIGAAMERMSRERSGKVGDGLSYDQQQETWELGRLQFVDDEVLLKLKDVDGLIGVVDDSKNGSQAAGEARENAPLLDAAEGEQTATTKGAAVDKTNVASKWVSVLGLGAPGIITKDLVKKRKRHNLC